MRSSTLQLLKSVDGGKLDTAAMTHRPLGSAQVQIRPRERERRVSQTGGHADTQTDDRRTERQTDGQTDRETIDTEGGESEGGSKSWSTHIIQVTSKVLLLLMEGSIFTSKHEKDTQEPGSKELGRKHPNHACWQKKSRLEQPTGSPIPTFTKGRVRIQDMRKKGGKGGGGGGG